MLKKTIEDMFCHPPTHLTPTHEAYVSTMKPTDKANETAVHIFRAEIREGKKIVLHWAYRAVSVQGKACK